MLLFMLLIAAIQKGVSSAKATKIIIKHIFDSSVEYNYKIPFL